MAKNDPVADPFIAPTADKPVKVKRDRTTTQRAQLLTSAANYLRDMATAIKTGDDAAYKTAVELHEAHMDMYHRITNVHAAPAPTQENAPE